MNGNEVNLEGKRNVEAELRRRGAASVSYHKHETKIEYLHSSNAEDSRTVRIQVKVKRKGSWHTTGSAGEQTDTPPEDVSKFWIFVDLGGKPRYWIVPEWWIKNNIYEVHKQYLAKNNGHRPVNDASDHHGIVEKRLEGWLERWDLLGIF